MLKAAQHHIVDAGDGIRLVRVFLAGQRQAIQGVVHSAARLGGKFRFHLCSELRPVPLPTQLCCFQAQLQGSRQQPSSESRFVLCHPARRSLSGRQAGSPFFKQRPGVSRGIFPGRQFCLENRQTQCCDNGHPSLETDHQHQPCSRSRQGHGQNRQQPLFLAYFMKKWKKSLARKQRLFPGQYDFSDVLQPQIHTWHDGFAAEPLLRLP